MEMKGLALFSHGRATWHSRSWANLGGLQYFVAEGDTTQHPAGWYFVISKKLPFSSPLDICLGNGPVGGDYALPTTT